MKPTKFRAWIPHASVMIDVRGLEWNHEAIKFVYLASHVSRTYRPTGGSTPKVNKISYSSCKLMQCTGLKDKNGVEIYEGDIIEYDGQIMEVKWDDSRDDIESPMVGFWLGWAGNFYHPRSIEVIGNIYENPELVRGGHVQA